MVSLKRGQPGNHRHDKKIILQTLALLHEQYKGFEKLTERHDTSVSLETLRQWMIVDGLWVPHNKHKP